MSGQSLWTMTMPGPIVGTQLIRERNLGKSACGMKYRLQKKHAPYRGGKGQYTLLAHFGEIRENVKAFFGKTTTKF